VKMILLDTIFIIELFLRNFEREKYQKHDYILSNAWLEFHIKQDLILLENQLPFKFSKSSISPPFNGSEEVAPFLELTCQFFFSDKHRIPMDKKVKHFTDRFAEIVLPSYWHKTWSQTYQTSKIYNHKAVWGRIGIRSSWPRFL